MVVEKFKEAKARSAAFKLCIPRWSRSEPERRGGPGPSRSEDWGQGQVISVTNRGPPPPPSRGCSVEVPFGRERLRLHM